MQRRSRTLIQAGWILALIMSVAIGCRATKPSSQTLRSSLRESTHTAKSTSSTALLKRLADADVDESLQSVISDFKNAEKNRHAGDSKCISNYAHVALTCWPQLQPLQTIEANTDTQSQLAWDVYHESVRRLLETALEHGQFDPEHGISFTTEGGDPALIAVTHHGFPWQGDDFNEVQVLHQPVDSKLARYWSDPGLGVPLVIIRRRDQKQDYLGKAIPYSATGILRPQDSISMVDAVSYLADIQESNPDEVNSNDFSTVLASGETFSVAPKDSTTSVTQMDAPTVAVLELHDSVHVTDVAYQNQHWRLKRDTSAPLGIALNEFHHHKYKSFLLPGKADEDAGLRMIEPYQPGKIPLVLVHGLLSDRATWVDLANDLRSSPWFNEHYQIWFFQYETGQPYITSALEMRMALQEVFKFCDPHGSDPAMSQMVLVGHSMGGLVSKLQISSSGTALWDSIALIPADQIRASAENHRQIKQLFFFDPLPFVKRTVFIGSPHQGSNLAKSWVGRLGSALVHPPKEIAQSRKSVIAENPGVFIKDVTRHIPTSVDLLRPDNPLLMATYTLPVNPNVRLHTIIGNGRKMPHGVPADGVVPVASARHPGTQSERLIDTTHTQLPNHPETTDEIVRILNEHLREIQEPSVASLGQPRISRASSIASKPR